MLAAVLSTVSLPDLVAAQDRPVVAMIGTGNVGAGLGVPLARLGYTVVYGSRNPDRESVRELVERSGPTASAATQSEAAALGDIIILAVPKEALESVSESLGNVEGKVLVDMSSPEKRTADDGYHEIVGDSANAERVQSWHPEARVVRIAIPSSYLFARPMLLGVRPTVPIAGQDPRAKEVVAQLIFDIGMDPWDAGPLRYARYLDVLGLLSTVPLQQGRDEGIDALALVPSSGLPCFMDVREAFGAGDPYDLDDLARFPRRGDPIPCEDWMKMLGMEEGG
jgi:predicted dinucleotide-binding enzyme